MPIIPSFINRILSNVKHLRSSEICINHINFTEIEQGSRSDKVWNLPNPNFVFLAPKFPNMDLHLLITPSVGLLPTQFYSRWCCRWSSHAWTTATRRLPVYPALSTEKGTTQKQHGFTYDYGVGVVGCMLPNAGLLTFESARFSRKNRCVL